MIILKARPTEAQAEAGNYKMKRRSFRGLSISVENPAGSVREGTDRGGKKWRTKMTFDYGYIRSGRPTSRHNSLAQRCIANVDDLGDRPNALPAFYRGVDYTPIIGVFSSAVRDINAAFLQRFRDGARIYPGDSSDVGFAEAFAQEFHRLFEIPSDKTLGSVDALANKAAAYCVAAYAKLFGDAGNGVALRAKGFDSLDVNVKSAVQRNVLAGLHDFKIFGAIVKLLPVGVVDVFSCGQFPAQKVLDNQAMLLDRLSVSLDDPIWSSGGVFIDAIATYLPIAFAAWIAEEITGPSGMADAAVKRVAAVCAMNDRHVLSRLTPKAYVSTLGMDGDHVDCYVGPDADADNVYVIDQMAPPSFTKIDEQKCMLGFASAEKAKAAYLTHYDNPKFFGSMKTMPFDEFKGKVLATKDRPGMIKSAPVVVFFKSYVRAHVRRTKDGKVINVGSYHNSVVPEPAPLRGRGKDTLTGDLFGAQPGDGKKQDEETPDHERGEDGRRSALAMLPKQASFRDGKGIARGKVAVEIDGDVVSNYHEKPEDAAKEAMKFMAQNSDWEAKSKAEESAIRELRSRLVGGGLASDNDLKLLGLRPGSSGMRWFIPAAARLFGVSPRAIRPIVSDMIVNGKTESGADVEFVPPKKALRAISDHVRAGGTAAPTVTAPADKLIDEHRRLVRVLESPSHADDKAEAARQREELRGYEGRAEQGDQAGAEEPKFIGDADAGQTINGGKAKVIGNFKTKAAAEAAASKSDTYRVTGYEVGKFPRGWVVTEATSGARPVFQGWKRENSKTRSISTRSGRFVAYVSKDGYIILTDRRTARTWKGEAADKKNPLETVSKVAAMMEPMTS